MAVLRKMLLEAPPEMRIFVAALVVLLPVGSVLAAGTFIWDQTNGRIWSTENNWTAPATCTADCYPHTTDDDAIVEDGSTSTIELDDDYTIDDLTFSSGVSHDIQLIENGEPSTLSCDSIVIESDSEVRVRAQVKVVARKTGDPVP